MAESIEILKRNNSGIYIEERDFSVNDITQFYNQINLVIGCSKQGAFNLPIVVVSPDNFEQVYGKIDYQLERKGSFFHRTVKNLLETGPVICLNLRLTDKELDKYNFINLSTSSDSYNSNTRTASVEDFFDRTDGFWRRTPEQVLRVVNDTVPNADKNPMTLVNQSSKPISILIYKSDVKGFDIPMEDWYEGNVPPYLHPKDLVSDYMISILAVEGNWNNYEDLHVHPKWTKYFSKDGIRRDKIDQFLNEPEVILVRKWTGSTIPYFKDNSGKDIYIASVVNDDVNETGILLAYNPDILETEYKNGLIDLLGDNLSSTPKPQIDFLSYKRNLSDYFIIEEKLLDQPNNSFGNHLFDSNNRTQRYAEGYVNGAKFKPIIINTTSSLFIKPLDCSDDDDSYVVINGNKILLNNDIQHVISLPETLIAGTQVAYVVYVDSEGVKYKVSEKQPVWQTLVLPSIDPNNELVLGYYRIWQETQTNDYHTELFGVTIDDKGFIDPFRQGTEGEAKIICQDLEYDWQQKIYFEKASKLSTQDYHGLRIYHLWYWLSQNLIEKESLIIDTLGKKQLIDRVELGKDTNGRWISISLLDKTANVKDVDGTTGLVAIYMQDLEFLPQSELSWTEKIEPYVTGSDGVIGDDSLIYDSFKKGEINSGDPFFWSIAKEEKVIFKNINGNGCLILTDGPQKDYIGKKIIIFGSSKNDGMYTVLNFGYTNGEYTLYLDDRLNEESVDSISIFDGGNPKIVNLYFVEGKMKAKVEDYDGNAEDLYRRIFLKETSAQWNKTIEIEQWLNPTTILVNSDYSQHLREGYYLRATPKAITDSDAERKRNWTRIVDLVRWSEDSNLLMVETDSAIEIKDIDGDLQTEMLIPIDMWVNTLDFKVLEPYIVRKEVLPDGTEEMQNKILNLISKETKMAKALCTDRMEWRYLVDSFGKGLTGNSKQQLARLCEMKQTCMGFINLPSIKDFRKNDRTVFNSQGVFDTKLLLKGGERRNTTGTKFSLTQDGKSHVIYLTPFVVIEENGRMIEVPPSSYAARLYMKKHNDMRFKPSDIIAGTNHRINNIAGLEENFTQEQLEDFDRMRITAITSYQNIIFYLNSENTAENSTSLLGSAHNRESLIELELALKEELNKYQWSNFSDENIERMVTAANELCQQFKDDEIIAEYFNEFETTPELQDAQIGVMNTYIELVAGMKKILLRVNVYSTGGLRD